LRNGKQSTLSLKLVAAPETPPRDAIKIKTLSQFQGALVVNISPAIIEELSLANAQDGVVVAEAPEGSTAANVGVQKGDVIRAVNGHKIETTRDLEKASAAHPDFWKVTIERGGQTIQTVIGG
jgi:S1-C subfamily serine protease